MTAGRRYLTMERNVYRCRPNTWRSGRLMFLTVSFCARRVAQVSNALYTAVSDNFNYYLRAESKTERQKKKETVRGPRGKNCAYRYALNVKSTHFLPPREIIAPFGVCASCSPAAVSTTTRRRQSIFVGFVLARNSRVRVRR